MTKKKQKATESETKVDHSKAIGILLADAAKTKATIASLEDRIDDLKAEVGVLAIQVRSLSSEQPRRQLLARLFGRR